MTVGRKEYKHKIFISPKSHILAFENSYPFIVSKYMPFLVKTLYDFKQKILKYQVRGLSGQFVDNMNN